MSGGTQTSIAMNLFLDDERMPSSAFYITRDTRYNLLEWKIVRDYFAFTETIMDEYAFTGKLPEIISFDHDLADIHYEDAGKKEIDYSRYDEKTGYHCAQWLVDFCMDRNLKLPECLVHSMNTVGKRNIEGLLTSFRKHEADTR